jgi:hypothetical protein
MKVIGYRVNGECFGVYTHLGAIYISRENINVYLDDKLLEEDYNKMKRKSLLKKADHNKALYRLVPKYRGGRVFISKLKSSEFNVESLDDRVKDKKNKVLLRILFKYKQTQRNELPAA